MSEAIIAKRYADALFQLANEKSVLATFQDELTVVQQVFEENSELQAFLAHPRVSSVKKHALLDEAFSGVSKEIVNTLKILVDRHRTGIITELAEAFQSLVNELQGIAQGTIYSVRKLSDAEKADLENTLAKRLNKAAVKLENVIDPSIIGGVRIRIANTIYDGTISGKLRRIEQKFKLGM